MDLSSVLVKFTKVTKYMSTESHVSSSELYPIVCGLLNSTVRVLGNDSSLVRKVKDTTDAELNARFTAGSTEIFKSPAAFATLLDPRHKKTQLPKEKGC